MSASDAAQGATPGGDNLLELAMLGKTALALAVVVGIILLCSYALRRLNAGRGQAGRHLKVVASAAVGQKERVVVIQVEETWLVLGVGGGQVNALHHLPAPAEPPEPPAADAGGFATRLASALRQGKARSGDDGASS
ncbi:flagellar biosynthetic protein FliO [Modicisalibacter tunisiensis]|uniref:Flagellar protein n=1 Tax=Modicisalibacter tunisiensis TaxID=390637 RepID=A0ABS7X145_9GAMM|nr:flagellar biosynthetic protein FliO [Modicisalibacter tunisiensis]MBZ9538313.1 flagellar biosynthetic protein FliO [Modicisalibacter tunisiensis]MBZ9568275.1 flagellar biosynthetic protein FliO [Modicisalibacter tunisiensis]